MYGYFVKRTEDDFVIDVSLDQKGSGYNVVPRETDPWNKYDIAEVQAYAQEHPEREVAWSEEENRYIPIMEELEE
jgi:hypothetical protein